MDLELRHLRALVAVVDEGSFTAAADALGLSQASISRAVAGLERAVGAQVLRRTSRELALTAAGADVLGHARRILEDAAAIERVTSKIPGEVRVGFAWAALGAHTVAVQRRWAETHPGSELRFVPVNTATAGLTEGTVDVAVVRQRLDDDRFASVLVGVERRYAAVPADHPLAGRRSVSLNDLAGETVAVDVRTGTTTLQLWPTGAGPAATRSVDGIDDWLTLIAAGQALGLSAEATARQHPRPGIAFRPVRDAPPIPVSLLWWRDSPPSYAAELTQLVCDAYAEVEASPHAPS